MPLYIQPRRDTVGNLLKILDVSQIVKLQQNKTGYYNVQQNTLKSENCLSSKQMLVTIENSVSTNNSHKLQRERKGERSILIIFKIQMSESLIYNLTNENFTALEA